jgi:hypothetical protein
MTAALAPITPTPSKELTLDDLYYWDPEQRRYIWTELHLQLFLEQANTPIEPIDVKVEGTIICYVDSLEHLL